MPGPSDEDETAHIQRLLDEVELAEKHRDEEEQKTQNTTSTSSQPGSPKRHFLFADNSSDAGSADGIVDSFPPYDAAKHGESESMLRSPGPAPTDAESNGNGADGAYFLLHAFPMRTKEFLTDTLAACHGDVGMTVDTLMAIDLAEREEAEEAARAALPPRQPSPSSPSTKGLDYEALARGGSSIKGKKGRAMRRKAHDDYLRSIGADTGPGRDAITRVTLGDVRQGGSTPRTTHTPRRSMEHQRSPVDEAAQLAQAGLSDFEIARQLSKADDPEAGEPVKDNQWLLSSSILSQLTDLLDIDSHQVSSAYNRSGFNLHIAVGRLIDASADQYPTLSTLDSAGDCPEGTAESIVRSLASVAGKGVAVTALCLRATKGKQDATLDLLNLMDVVRDAAGGERPDELDPLGKLRHPDHVSGPSKPAPALSSQQGVSVDAAALNPKPGETVDLEAIHRAQQAGGFSRAAIAGRNNPSTTASGQAKAMLSVREGSTPTVSFPPSAAQVNLDSIPSATRLMFNNGAEPPALRANGQRTIRDREVAIARAQELASDYHARRNRCLMQASTAWRSSPTNRGAAFYYADEARRLEAKSRAWSLRAAEELVAYRQAGSSVGVSRPGVIDLHGVTVREALSIVGEELNSWWSKPGKREPLTIITGAGRHSPNQVAILTPSVAKYLQREQWRADVDRNRGVIVVRGR